MFQTHIVLTHTHVDISKLSMMIAYNFSNFSNLEKSVERLNDIEEVDIATLEKNWQKMMAKNLIIQKNYSKKEEFTKNLLSLYEVYESPVLLFLGDLSQYSTQLQEGMLKLLEEPPKNLIIVLYSQNRVDILPTIESRSRFHTLQKKLVLKKLLDSDLLEKTKKKFPLPSDFIKSYLKDEVDYSTIDLKKVEREEMSFWLWQLIAYLEEYYKQHPTKKIAEKITNLLSAMSLNSQNLQKKFVLGWLE